MKELIIDLDLLKKLDCRSVVIYEYIREKYFRSRGEVMVTYKELMEIFDTKADKSITRSLKLLESKGLIRIRKTNKGNYYSVTI